MHIVAGCANELPIGVLFDMARYRYEVFVHRLGWPLPTQGRMELDQFDRRDTVYVVGRNAKNEVIGTARLLPTHRPYLLAEVFPQLLNGEPVPCSPRTWELSRFAFLDLDDDGSAQTSPRDSRPALDFLRAVMRFAVDAGAHHLVSVSPVAIERILRRGGIPYRRAGTPMKVGSETLFACSMPLANPMLTHAQDTAGLLPAALPRRSWRLSSSRARSTISPH